MLDRIALKPIFRTVGGLLLLLNNVEAQPLASYSNDTQGLTGFPPCDALAAANLSHVLYLPSSPLFPELVDGYWSLNTRKAPWCFVRPRDSAEVSETITALRAAGNGAGDWHIAVRSGGHGSDDSNNIANGVTIDLSQLNATTYNAATNIASVGSGSRWLSVYDSLDKHGVSVAGGREGIVGVGGLTLGGGNSWYTAKTGFACDSVINYEIVLANGEMINASASAHADLWRALKGGGSNFGIVTRFDIEAFPARNLTMQTRTVGLNHSHEFVDAVAGFADLDQSFRDNAMLSLMSWTAQTGTTILIIEVNTAGNGDSTAFDALNRIPTIAPSTKESVNLVDSANRTQVAAATRNAGAYLTIANDPRVMRYCISQHNQLVTDLLRTLAPEDFSTIVDFQPLSGYFADISAQKGGNMLGLQPGSRNKIFFTAGVTLLNDTKSEDQYNQVLQMVWAMTGRIEAYAASLGADEKFIYMNYAHANQDPLGSYGEANVRHIKQVAAKYDRHGFFQRRVPGGYKISRVG